MTVKKACNTVGNATACCWIGDDIFSIPNNISTNYIKVFAIGGGESVWHAFHFFVCFFLFFFVLILQANKKTKKKQK